MRSVLMVVPLVVLAVAGWRDLLTRTIPNHLPLILAAAGLSLRLPGGIAAALVSCGLALLLFGALALAHAGGALGGGDVKLAAALAVGLPGTAFLPFIMATALAGGGLAAAHLTLRLLPRAPSPRGCLCALRRIYAVERWRVERRGSLPYGIAIACGGAWAMLSGYSYGF